MNLEITTNAAGIAEHIGATAKQVEKAARKATRAATRVLYDEDRKQLNAIYKMPVPKHKTGKNAGKPRWKRTGMLRRGEVMKFPDPLSGILHNDTPYAEHRHDMEIIGKYGDRRVAWRRLAWKVVPQMCADAFDKKFAEEMGKQ